MNSGAPSEVNSSGMPKVAKVLLRVLMRPMAPLVDPSTIGQLE